MEGSARSSDTLGEEDIQARPSTWSVNPFSAALWVTLVVGLPIFAACVMHLDLSVVPTDDLWSLGILFVLVVLGETRPLIATKTYGQGGVTPSTAFTFAILFTWGLAPAVVFHAVGSVLADLIERKAWWKTLFNIGQYSVSIASAWLVLVGLGWQASLAAPHAFARGDLGMMVLAWAVYFVVNNSLVSFVVALYNGERFRDVFYEDFGYQVFTNVAVLTFSGIVTMVIAAGPEWLPLVLPGMVAIYATAGMALDREHQANHDSLTSLPNRKLLVEQLGQALEAREEAESVALFVLDLDRFKEVNDTLGHQTGDALLRIVAQRLRDAVRPADTVARLGGDEFAVLLCGVRDQEVSL
jgi:GGDEF domain-containing protein